MTSAGSCTALRHLIRRHEDSEARATEAVREAKGTIRTRSRDGESERSLLTFTYEYTAMHISQSVIFLSLLVPRRNSLPVDYIPDRIEVLGLAVLVLEVVRMLPRINTEQGHPGPAYGVLVGALDDGQVAACLVLGEPRPPATLDPGEGCVHLLAEGVEGAEVLVDGALW